MGDPEKVAPSMHCWIDRPQSGARLLEGRPQRERRGQIGTRRVKASPSEEVERGAAALIMEEGRLDRRVERRTVGGDRVAKPGGKLVAAAGDEDHRGAVE